MLALPRPALVAVGAAGGTTVRWLVAAAFESGGLTVEILALNLLGSVLVGWLLGHQSTDADVGAKNPLWYLVAVGFGGGLTTFSTFALDVAVRLDQSELGSALSLGGGTVLVTVSGAALGHRVGLRR